MTGSDEASAAPYALYPIRLALGIVFVIAGWGKFAAFGPWRDAVAGLGIPLPTVVAALVAVAELFGGLGVVLGVLARFSAAVLSVIMATALFAVRIFGPWNVEGWRLDALLLAGALTVVVNGPGRPTVWSFLDLEETSAASRARALVPGAG